ncbi:unnamed protein product [Adineta ricciae]|uniref:Uncharacterized protein n=1 Tax=Adineta ricciae TaxID=249248 RepID=A0A814KA18_ADIRI|nr:unnamed protein product [Adineta ricciae]CAF1612358.1 unnamed protein product [Adineta ricciae]
MPVSTIIEQTGKLSCVINSTEGRYNDFQLCAIRIYTALESTSEINDVVVQNGMWFMNVFRRLIATRQCEGFSETSDIGTGICNPMSYETADQMTLCICASDYCNLDLETCQIANRNLFNVSLLPKPLPVLSDTIECNQTSEVSEACYEHSLINQDTCNNYVNSHKVLCTIGVSDNVIVQTGYLEENYGIFLDKKLHDLKPVIQAYPENPLIDAQTYVYYMYSLGTDVTSQECACTQSSYCNMNITLCAPLSTQIDTTASTLVTTDDLESEQTSDMLSVSMNTQSIANIMTTNKYTVESSSIQTTTHFATERLTTSNGTSEIISISITESKTYPATSEIVETSILDEATSSTTEPTMMSNTISLNVNAIESTTTIYFNGSNPSTVIPNMNSGLIIGIIVGVIVFLVIVFSLICCQCVRLGMCQRTFTSRSANYQL